jgi:hypothetical protein
VNATQGKLTPISHEGDTDDPPYSLLTLLEQSMSNSHAPPSFIFGRRSLDQVAQLQVQTWTASLSKLQHWPLLVKPPPTLTRTCTKRYFSKCRSPSTLGFHRKSSNGRFLISQMNSVHARVRKRNLASSRESCQTLYVYCSLSLYHCN